jgi:hypothetical protein
MIVFDFSNIAHAALAVQLQQAGNGAQADEGLLRHLVLNSIRATKVKAQREYGDLVIACDSKKSWRHDVFPYYKAARRKAKDEGIIDWKAVHAILDLIKAELAEYFPYRVIEIDGAEGDDVIGALCAEYGQLSPEYGGEFSLGGERILIVSRDGDFHQLHKYDNVSQWNPIDKKMVHVPNPILALREKIFRGDVGDGVPNFLSDDDTIVTEGKRQKPIMKAKLSNWIDMNVADVARSVSDDVDAQTKILKNYARNERLIDLSYTPLRIRDEIINKYEREGDKKIGPLMQYFMKFRLRNLTEHIGDFV